jgi:hypothetical protein
MAYRAKPMADAGSGGLRGRGRSGALAVLAATAGRAGAERFVHDAPDRAGATPALRAASETAVDLGGRARRRFGDGGTDLGIGEDVAGADDHGDAIIGMDVTSDTDWA